MPLSAAVPRELIHTRRIEGHGYLRQDGLWDIEGFLTDGKSYEFKNEHRGTVKPGEFIHQMWMRWTVDDTLTIRAVEAVTDNSPFAICPAITPKFHQLEGMRIAKGFNAKVFELFGGVSGCTHHTELIGRLATVAFQSIFPYRNRKAATEGRNPDASRRVRLVNTCHAFAEDGEIAKKLWSAPENKNGPEAGKPAS